MTLSPNRFMSPIKTALYTASGDELALARSLADYHVPVWDFDNKSLISDTGVALTALTQFVERREQAGYTDLKNALEAAIAADCQYLILSYTTTAELADIGAPMVSKYRSL